MRNLDTWETKSLGDLAKLITGKTPPTSVSEYFGDSIPWVTPADFKSKEIFETARTLTQKAIDDKKCNVLPSDCIVLNCIGDVGKVSILRKQGSSNQQITALLPKDDLEVNFLYYLLLTQNNNLKNLANEAVVPILNNERLKTLKISFPSRATQKRIAEILDKADELRKKDKQLLQYYDDLARSLLIDMFGDPVRNEKGWEEKRIGDACEFLTSGSRGWAKYYSEKGDIFLRINNVGNNKLKLDDIVYVHAPDSAEAKRTRVQAYDLLFSITADIGRTAVIPSTFPIAYINQHLALIRLKSIYNSNYVSEILSSDYGRNQLKRVVKGGVKAGLNFNDIRGLKFLNPPIDLQNKFAQQIQNIELQKDKLKAQIQESENLFQALLQKTFNGGLN